MQGKLLLKLQLQCSVAVQYTNPTVGFPRSAFWRDWFVSCLRFYAEGSYKEGCNYVMMFPSILGHKRVCTKWRHTAQIIQTHCQIFWFNTSKFMNSQCKISNCFFCMYFLFLLVLCLSYWSCLSIAKSLNHLLFSVGYSFFKHLTQCYVVTTHMLWKCKTPSARSSNKMSLNNDLLSEPILLPSSLEIVSHKQLC